MLSGCYSNSALALHLIKQCSNFYLYVGVLAKLGSTSDHGFMICLVVYLLGCILFFFPNLYKKKKTNS